MKFLETLSKLLLVLSISVIVSSSGVAKSIVVKGAIKNAPEGTQLYLYKVLGMEFVKLDSSKISNNQFKFKPADYPRGMYKIGVNDNLHTNIIIANEDLDVVMDYNTITNLPQINNSVENKLYQSIMTVNSRFTEFSSELDKSAQPILQYRQTEPERFNRDIAVLQFKLDSNTKSRNDFLKATVENNKNLYASKLANVYISSENTTKENFFTQSDLTDEELTRSDFLSTKIILYLQKYVVSQETDVVKESSDMLVKPHTGTKNKEVFFNTIIKLFTPYDGDYARTLGQLYKTEYPNSDFAKKTYRQLPKGAPQVGDTAPDVMLKDVNGKSLSLNSLKGKVVLLDFWASWCGPCRKENPNVVQVYEKYKDKGFTVFSVSLDNDKDKWIRAIEQDKLVWKNHVSDLKGWQSEGAATYSVKGIPAAFLIDKNGKIVATNLRGEALEQKVAEILNK